MPPDSAPLTRYAPNQLIQSALENNMDVQGAAAVEEFYGRYRTTRSFLFPQLTYDALGEARQAPEADRAPGAPSVTDCYQADVGVVDYEIDFWGRLRRATEAARADLLASEEAKRTVILTLAAAVADSYSAPTQVVEFSCPGSRRGRVTSGWFEMVIPQPE